MISFWLTLKQQWSSPLFSIFSLVAILVGSRDHRTQFWKGAIQGPFHSTKVWLQLAQWFLRRRLKCEMLTDGRRTKSDDNSSHGLKARWAKKDFVYNCWTPYDIFDRNTGTITSHRNFFFISLENLSSQITTTLNVILTLLTKLSQ